MSVESTLMLLLGDAEQRRGGRRSADELGLERSRVDGVAVGGVLDDDGVGCVDRRIRGGGGTVNVEVEVSEGAVAVAQPVLPLATRASVDHAGVGVHANLGGSVRNVHAEVTGRVARSAAGGSLGGGGGWREHPSPFVDTCGRGPDRKERNSGERDVAVGNCIGKTVHQHQCHQGADDEA